MLQILVEDQLYYLDGGPEDEAYIKKHNFKKYLMRIHPVSSKDTSDSTLIRIFCKDKAQAYGCANHLNVSDKHFKYSIIEEED